MTVQRHRRHLKITALEAIKLHRTSVYVSKDDEPRPPTAAELAAERITRDPAGVARDAARGQALVDNLNRNVLSNATPEERAAAERYHRLRQQCELESLEAFALRRIADDMNALAEHGAIAQAELDRREAEFERLLVTAKDFS
jgi:hypothetical protein